MLNKKIQLIKLNGTPQELLQMQAVLEAAPQYSLKCNGRLPLPNDARDDFANIPEGLLKSEKFCWGIVHEEKIIGLVDALRGYPNANIAYLGLLVLREDFQSKGFGRVVYQDVEKIFRNWEGINLIRLAVVQTNDQVLPFWNKLGFQETGIVKDWNQENIKTKVIIMEKSFFK
ncbi:MAG: GNAT family N-acetyltransferase [Bacteriovorax sp.]|nr:GNAT family N-acetyltransferase [Bacteriovorax sp.]